MNRTPTVLVRRQTGEVNPRLWRDIETNADASEFYYISLGFPLTPSLRSGQALTLRLRSGQVLSRKGRGAFG
jgi:hypothetical protein